MTVIALSICASQRVYAAPCGRFQPLPAGSDPIQLKPLQRKALLRIAAFASLIRVDPNWVVTHEESENCRKIRSIREACVQQSKDVFGKLKS